MPKTSVTFYYDLISPWAYVAFHLLRGLEKPWDLDITLKPVALGYVFQAAENRAPLNVPNKGLMMKSEFQLACDYYQIPISPQCWTLNMAPNKPPPDSRSLQRFLRVVETERPEALDAVTERLYHALFGRGRNELWKPSANALVDALGTDVLDAKTVDSFLERSEKEFKRINDEMKDEAKDLVKNNGIYGVPYLAFKKAGANETRNFWGSDKFELIAYWLGKPYTAQGHHASSKL